MTYLETLDHMSRLGRFGMKLGTNGKGSTGACIASILKEDGHAVGFMPKPHLISYTERIQLNGEPISETDFVAAFEAIRPTLDSVAAELGQATEFEMLTAMAIAHLAPRVDELVCEVGLGGRLDATNALDLGVAVITNVDLDHQKYLGDTIEKIAHEKAAIIKQRNSMVTGCEGSALSVDEEHARAAKAPVWVLGRDVHVESKSRGWEGHTM